MNSAEIVLANESRFLRGMLVRAISQMDALDISAVVKDLSLLPDTIHQVRPDWIIVSQQTLETHSGMYQDILKDHPELRILGMNIQDSDSVLYCLSLQKKELGKLSLRELGDILERKGIELSA